MTRQLVILGTSVTLPDPGSVSDLAARFAEQGDQLADLETSLQSLTKPEAWASWTGQAADAFGQSIGQVPGAVGEVRDAYDSAAAALRQYANQLEPVVNSLSSLYYPAEEAESTLASVKAARTRAIASGQNPVTTGWDARLADANAEVSVLRSQLNRLLGELTALAATCTRQIKAAEPVTAHESLFGTLESDFKRDVADPVGHGAVDAYKGVLKAGKITGHLLDETLVKPFTQLPGDLVAYYRDPDLHTAGELLQDVGDAVGAVALVLTVAAVAAAVVAVSIGSGGVADAALAGAFVALDTAGDLTVVSEAAHIDALGANTGAVVSHENGASWSDVSNSALSVVADKAGDEIGDDDIINGIVFSAGSGLEITAFGDGLKHDLSLPAAAPDAPDVPSGLEVSADSVQGLQGISVSAGPTAGAAGILQPAVSVASPAVVNIQRVALSPQPGGPSSSGGSTLEGIQ